MDESLLYLTINNSDKCGAVLGHELFDPHRRRGADRASPLCNEAQAPTAEMAVTPPSIRKSAPTTYAESSDARYTASFAISNGSAIRLLGLLVRRTSLTASPCSSPEKRPNIAVSVGPGLRVFTRIPRSTSSALRIRARWTTAALQGETVEVVGHPLRAVTDALMITDEPCVSSGKAF